MARERMAIGAVPKSKSPADGIGAYAQDYGAGVRSVNASAGARRTPASALKLLANLAHGTLANRLVVLNAVSIATVRKAAPNGGPLQIANRFLERSGRLRPLHTLVGKPPIL